MDLVPIEYKYYDFVRELRMNPQTQDGFLKEVSISWEDQKKYMSQYGESYHVCVLSGTPVGYIGVLDNDIRFCTHPDHQRKGVGSFMLREIKKLYPEATGRIKKDNISSQKAFDKVGIPYILIPKITILTDNPNSWILPYVEVLKNKLRGYDLIHVYDKKDVREGDILFMLSCERIISQEYLSLNTNNIVVHPSPLPMYKGWSPMAYQVLDGLDEIVVSLF